MSTFVNIKNIQIAYEESGHGIPLLLVHGFPLNNKIWAQQATGLSDACRVIMPDLRGHGASSAPAWSSDQPQPFTMDLLADDLATFLDAINIKERIVLAGLSMGGYVSFAFYRHFPERVAGLVLAATRAGADSLEAKAGREQAAKAAIANGVSAIADAMLPRMFAPQTYQTNPGLVNECRQIMLNTSLAGVTGDLFGMRDRIDSTPTLTHIQVPTLVIHGDNDSIFPLQEAKATAEAIPGAQLAIIPGTGHLLNMEKPDEFNTAVKEFIQSLE